MSDTSPAAGTTSAGTHFPCLDAYRAIGMTMVLLNHAAFATGFVLRHDLGRVVARFDLAVPMFFVLSGFLLYRPFARSALAGAAPPDVRRFYRGRALRILPGYWVAVVGVALVFGTSPDGVGGWIANLLALPAVGVDVPYSITPAWSIGVEVSFYLLLPLYALAIGRWVAATPGGDAGARVRRLLYGTLGLFLAGQLFRCLVIVGLDGHAALQARTLLVLPMYLDLFATGMAAAILSVAGREQQGRAAAWAGAHPVACWVAAGLLLLLVSRMRAPIAPFGLNGFEYVPRQLAYSVISALWLAPAIFGDQSVGRLRRVLAARPLAYLGTISLSFYLWHLSFVEQAKEWTIAGYDELVARAARAAAEDPSSLDTLLTFTGSWPKVAATAFVATLVVAAAINRLVEQPFLRIKATTR